MSQKETSSVCQVGRPAERLAPFPKSRLEKLQRETGTPGINNKNKIAARYGKTPGEMAQIRAWPWALSCTQYQTQQPVPPGIHTPEWAITPSEEKQRNTPAICAISCDLKQGLEQAQIDQKPKTSLK